MDHSLYRFWSTPAGSKAAQHGRKQREMKGWEASWTLPPWPETHLPYQPLPASITFICKVISELIHPPVSMIQPPSNSFSEVLG